jgi:hypothetical protein
MSGIREADVLDFGFQMAWGLGLELRFSDSKSDVLPVRRPPNTQREMARGPGVEPGFSDPESDLLPTRRSPKQRAPAGQPTGALIQKADHSLPSIM